MLKAGQEKKPVSYFQSDTSTINQLVHLWNDALRRWLALHPDEMDRFRASKPSGPLAITHRTGRRKNSTGTERRFDSFRISRHRVVRHIEHLSEEGIAAGSDHAPVMVDLELT